MSDTSMCPPGRWEGSARRRAAWVAAPRWYTGPDRLTFSAGNTVLATVTSNGADGADARWVLRVTGWQWRVDPGHDLFMATKPFMSRSGAQLEAEDIIAAAAEWVEP